MKNLIFIQIALLLFSYSAFAQFDPDPGARDSVIVDSVYVPQGTTNVNVPIYAVTDDSVASYNIPLHWTPDGIGVHAHVEYGWPLTCWNVVFDTFFNDQQFARLFSILDMGDPDQQMCYLYTDGVRMHIMTMHFALPPDLPSMAIIIDTTYDPLNGSMYFGSWDGLNGWVPGFKKGYIIIGDPTTINEIANPNNFALNQNYPNPFNPSTQIEFAVPKSGLVILEIYDILGRHIKKLLNNNLDIGQYSVIWDGTNNSGQDVPSGAYFYKLTANNFVQKKKMLLIR